MKVPRKAISESPCASVPKQVFLQNLSFEKKFDLHENGPAGGWGTFSNKWSYSKPRFDIEAKDDSEMAYWASNSLDPSLWEREPTRSISTLLEE